EIEASERDRARRKPPESLDAWERFQRGLSHFYRTSKDDNEKAIRLFAEAVELDPTFAAAHAYHSYASWWGVPMGFSDDPNSSLAVAREAAERAAAIDPQEPLAHFSLGRLHIFAGEVEMAIREMQTAVSCNPNSARAHYGLGFACHYGAGQLDQALNHYDAALRLSPRDPQRWLTLTLKGEALRTDGRYDEAISHCQQACQFPDCGFISYMHLAASLVGDGRDQEALTAIERAKKINRDLSIEFLRKRFISMHETLFQSLLDNLRKAGLPEA
ncbi:MAG: tetratricopeptide repeat protein, partial [Alphaproteobacteria bacterium]|nr:tetratricopeptide repeat protein [Alphaproteobacteria bacterium]